MAIESCVIDEFFTTDLRIEEEENGKKIEGKKWMMLLDFLILFSCHPPQSGYVSLRWLDWLLDPPANLAVENFWQEN